ncbi:MAG TPA: hypothetical protein VK483_03500 [Chitinophagaceae bacterium]|nr:hypothetical protein [Chitinophagaceae bacterium]
MKKILSLLAVILFTAIGAFSQAPGIFNYQGVARNSVGNVLVNKSIALRITIHDGTPAGAIVYQETRGVVTNPFGLFNAQVGSAGATNVTGTIAGVPWGVGNKYIQVEIDPAGGTSFINIGTAQIASVPYALFSTSSADLVLPFVKSQSSATTLFSITNTGTGGSGLFAVNNAAGTSDALQASTNGAASSWALRATSTGLQGAGIFQYNNGTGAANALRVLTNGTGFAANISSSNATPKALLTLGGLQLTGISEANNRILASDAAGNALWKDPSAVGVVTGSGTVNFVPKWSPTTTNLANSQIFDNGTNVGINTVTPAYKLDVVHGGGTGIEARGTGGFSVVDVDASNGDAALRFLNAGAFRWNIRNDPAGNDLQIFDMGAGLARMRLLTANGNLGIATAAPAYRLDVDASVGAGSNGLRVRNTASFATIDIVGATTDQALRFGKNGVINSGINTLPDGDHMTFFKFGVGNLMAVNVNTGNLGVGGTIINPVAKVHARGFNVANNLYSSSTGFLGATGFGSNDVTAQPTNEKWGIHTFVNGAVGTQHGIFAEPGTTAAVNTGLFGRVSTAPAGGQSFALFAFDPINTAATWAASIRGRLQYQDGNQGLNKILVSDATGNASWQTLAGGGAVSGSGTLNFIPKWTPDGVTLGNSLMFDNGTNIGLGTIAPTHRFTVSHGGATGISVRSTASFSVVDIDGFTGDAALRFGNNGVNQWNTRNRPADNYYEIFELGGGGSRVVIQDGTGNVGIGATVAPSYRLDVEHGGATGIRSLSTASFSVVDIDGFTGDAALRFQKQGTGMWNTRNRPADDYYEIFELGGGGSRVVIQDGTGNVGIGATVSPSYKLDVESSGSSGIRNKSTATFTVVDIDAFNGDAALRFARNGVNQWNTRNRPADDYYEIFELGGGGSRVVIQDGTGNMGVGETTNPTYRLDVLHGGATGIRSRSSATFSLVDIDGFNGDAALRFARAGVNQWNIRNNPANDDLQFFELGGGGERMRIENTTGRVWVDGDLHVDGTLSKTAGAFKIDHPLDPENKYLWHSFVESPDMMNIYNGNIVTDASGKATVQLPDYFEALNMEFRYQLTVIGTFAQAIINKEVSNNKFEIATNQPNVKVSWQVTGIRHDAYAEKNRIPNTVEKEAQNKGKYLTPEAFNQPKSKGIGYDKTVNEVSSINYTAPVSADKVAPATTGGSLDQAAIVPPVVQKVDNSGSVANVEPAKAVVKTLDVSGSVMQTEANKPSTKKVDVSGSVSDDMQKPAIKTQEPKADKTIEPAKQVKEVLPAILKGSSMDPDAKPVMPAVKTPDVTVPAQNSGNTQPAAEQKQVSKENNTVPSSTVPAKKD